MLKRMRSNTMSLILKNPDLFKNGRNSGWWLSGGINPANCIAAYQPVGAASLVASYTNLVNPGTYNAALGVAPTFDAEFGWMFDGATQYLTTGIYVASGWSWAIKWDNTTTNVSKDIFGSYDGADRGFSLAPKVGTGGAGAYWNCGGYQTSVDKTAGVGIATNGKGYYNGVEICTGITAWSGAASNYDIRIGGRNGATPSFRVCYIQALAIYNIDITSYVTAIYTAMAAL